MTQQAASKVVVELEKLGYVEAQADGTDKRVRRIALSKRGVSVVEKGRFARAELEAQVVKKVGRRVLMDARRALAALLQAVGGLEAVSKRRVKPPSS